MKNSHGLYREVKDNCNRWKMEAGYRNYKPEIVNSHNVEIQHLFLCGYDFTIFDIRFHDFLSTLNIEP
jgi:hypothetical protein